MYVCSRIGHTESPPIRSVPHVYLMLMYIWHSAGHMVPCCIYVLLMFSWRLAGHMVHLCCIYEVLTYTWLSAGHMVHLCCRQCSNRPMGLHLPQLYSRAMPRQATIASHKQSPAQQCNPSMTCKSVFNCTNLAGARLLVDGGRV